MPIQQIGEAISGNTQGVADPGIGADRLGAAPL